MLFSQTELPVRHTSGYVRCMCKVGVISCELFSGLSMHGHFSGLSMHVRMFLGLSMWGTFSGLSAFELALLRSVDALLISGLSMLALLWSVGALESSSPVCRCMSCSGLSTCARWIMVCQRVVGFQW